MRDAEMRNDANDGVRHLRYLTPGSPTSSRSVIADLFDRDEILLGSTRAEARLSMSPARRRLQGESRLPQFVLIASRPRRNTSACTVPTPLDAIQYSATLAESRHAMINVIVALIATALR